MKNIITKNNKFQTLIDNECEGCSLDCTKELKNICETMIEDLEMEINDLLIERYVIKIE